MNKHQILDFQIPKSVTPYNPTSAFTIPPNDSVTIELQGRESQAFGFDRVIPYSTNYDEVLISISINEQATILQPVQLSVVRELFLNNRLKGPIILQKQNKLTITLTDLSGVQVDGNISLAGYDNVALDAMQKAYQAKNMKMLQPLFLFAQAEIGANAVNQIVPIPNRSVPVQFSRFAVKTDSDPNITISLLRNNVPIRNTVFVDQVNYEFGHLYGHVPYLVNNNIDFALQASNSDGNAHNLSFLAEGYLVQS